MSTIGIFHYKVGGTDGVSLEIDKWKRVLEQMGHTVHLCAGDLGTLEGTLIEEMYHHRPDAERISYNTFCELRDYPTEAAYRADIKDGGFRVVSLGAEIQGRDGLGLVYIAPGVIEAAADQAVELLTDARLRQEIVEHNFQVARQHYSLQALRGCLAPLMGG